MDIFLEEPQRSSLGFPVRIISSRNNSYLDAAGATKLRDALNEALNAHDEKQRLQRERWEAARVIASYTGVRGPGLKVWGSETCANIQVNGHLATIAQPELCALLAKLTAIRDAYNEEQAANGTH